MAVKKKLFPEPATASEGTFSPHGNNMRGFLVLQFRRSLFRPFKSRILLTFTRVFHKSGPIIHNGIWPHFPTEEESFLLTSLFVLILLLVLIALGVDIFISLGLAGVLGILLFRGPDALTLAATSFFGQETTFELVALPLFVLMGHILAKSPIGSDLYTMATRWLSWLPGGLAIASIGACTVFGAVSGVSVAGVAAIGSMAVPEMLKRGYSYKIAAGSVVTAGALAMLIPPSVPFIIYSAITGESIAKLFIGGIVPGLVLAFMLSLFNGFYLVLNINIIIH